MNVVTPLTMDRETFLDWIEERETKHEWVDGRVTMMVKVSNRHARVVANLMFAIRKRIDIGIWDIAVEAYGVDTARSLRYPDVVVEPRRAELSHSAVDPILIAEVLSPSSTKTDMIEKPAEYVEHGALRDYLVLSQDQPIVWHWRRESATKPFAAPMEIRGRSNVVELVGLAIELPLAELYVGLPDL